jgi:anti-sigma factor RsiW
MSVPADDLTCLELVELVTEYVEGSLPPHQRVRFDAHLAHCPECRGHLDDVRATIAVAGRLTPSSLSGEAEAALLTTFRDWKRASRA